MNPISIVIPAFNEQDNIGPLCQALRKHLGAGAEIIFVDDGSGDETAQRVRDLRAADPLVRLIRFSRNFGHQAALLAGLKAARGAAVVTMDCDLQHPPELLPAMLEAWHGGAKVVQMVRRDTVGANWFKRITSALFYRLIGLLSESPVTRGAADYQLLDAQVVRAILQFSDGQPFLRGVVGWLGFPTRRIEYVAPPRHAGTPGYNLARMLHLFLNAVTTLSTKPLRLAFYLGFSTAVLCLLYSIFALAAYFMGKSVAGWTSIIMALTFLGGVQLICLGIMGEYIARIYNQTRHVPPFVIAEEPPESEERRAFKTFS